MRRNIFLSYVLSVIYHAWFWLGVWVFYYLRFTDYAGIGLIETIMIILAISLEIPTGVITDHIGKKKSLFLAFLLSGVGNMIFGYSTSFPMLVASVLIFSIGSSFYSGTLEAFQYDSLLQLKEQKKYSRVISNTNTLVMITFALSSILGGYLYQLIPGLPFLLLGLLQIIALIFVMLLTEPKIDSCKYNLKSILNSQTKGFRYLFANRKLIKNSVTILIIGIVVVVCNQALNDLAGVEYGFTPVQFGYLATLFYLISSIGSHFSSHVSKHFGNYKALVISGVVFSFTLIISPILGFIGGSVMLASRWGVFSLYENVSSTIINDNTPSKYRATTISTMNALKNIPYAFFAIYLGQAMQHSSVSKVSLYMGLLLLLSIIGSQIITKSFVHNRDYNK